MFKKMSLKLYLIIKISFSKTFNFPEYNTTTLSRVCIILRAKPPMKSSGHIFHNVRKLSSFNGRIPRCGNVRAVGNLHKAPFPGDVIYILTF